ncbi:SpoIID/LytB domain-containing protein [uncultured Nitrospira sp.]|uniref:SpoIID/LytB domain-containing protein n=1 Tax=uncultured Nitrospira sp. TaxID=157176 RepID=UPI00313FE8BC
MVCVEHRIGIVLLFVSWVMLYPPVVEAAEPAIRVGLADAAQVLSIQSADSFFLRLASGKRFHISGRVTIRMQGAGLLLNDRPVADSHLWVEGSAGTYQVRVETKQETSAPSNSGPEWVVRGPLEIQSNPSGLALINWIDLEEYVAGVVSGEVGAKWPLEALKAQAVAARTYVLYKKIENQQQSFDVVAGVQDQVYHGHSVRAESVLQAVAATRGQVVTYDNRPIFAAYSSTAAGPTEDALYVWALDLPYLKGVDCPFDEQAPRYDWRTSFSFDFLEQQLLKEGYNVGKIATFTPYTFTPSGRVDRVRLLHSRGEIILRGQDLRRVVGYSKIFSTQFSIESLGQEVVVVGHGAGHAVGMCQWGMREMAELGYDYQSIIRHYYPHTKLLPLDRVILTAAD